MKKKATRNRTLSCDENELNVLSSDLIKLSSPAVLSDIENKIICQNVFDTIEYLPANMVDLLILDPPYNLSKNYNGYSFNKKKEHNYSEWFEGLITKLTILLKPTASIYVCADWQTSIIIAPILQKHFNIKNRITWEREKGRGSKTNWKNNTEDIWFCTMSKSYTFNVDMVKMKKKVIAPYRNPDGTPKDWNNDIGGNYRLTYPSNIWTDITVPFWSMPENTNHPTQKPEKLIAKLLIASTNKNDLVLDPFLGSGTSAVVSKKLERKFVGIEFNKEYCCWALKRLNLSNENSLIQGYHDGVFWERNSLAGQSKK